MYQNWYELLFAHYSVEPELIQRMLPAGLKVDTFPDASGAERAWVGVVPFRMHGVRPRFLPPLPGLSFFLEANLRTYIYREDGRGPAVWFLSLEAANRLACALARISFQLPYHHADMSRSIKGDVIDYRSTRRQGGVRLAARWRIGEELGVSEQGSLEYFLAERYLLAAGRPGALRWGRVHHTPYRLHRAELLDWEEGLSAAVGLPGSAPEHVCYCPGVETRIWWLTRQL